MVIDNVVLVVTTRVLAAVSTKVTEEAVAPAATPVVVSVALIVTDSMPAVVIDPAACVPADVRVRVTASDKPVALDNVYVTPPVGFPSTVIQRGLRGV